MRTKHETISHTGRQIIGGVFTVHCIRLLLVAFCLMSALDSLSANAQNASASTTGQSATERDGQHDFDFEIGTWKIHLKRLADRLAGSKTWVEFDGTSVTHKIWDGRSQIEEFETDSPSGHIEGLTLRTYNPKTHEWKLYWANSKDGNVVVPQIGKFKDGQGEFYGMDTLNDKSILIRFIWSKTNTDIPHFEQAFSDDG